MMALLVMIMMIKVAKRDMLAGHNIENFKTTRCDFSL